jgi:hypothetical protein
MWSYAGALDRHVNEQRARLGLLVTNNVFKLAALTPALGFGRKIRMDLSESIRHHVD